MVFDVHLYSQFFFVLFDKFSIDKFFIWSIFNSNQCFVSFHDFIQISLFSMFVWFTCEAIMFKIWFIWDACFFSFSCHWIKFSLNISLIFREIEYRDAKTNWMIFSHSHCAKSVFFHVSMHSNFNRWIISFYL